MPPSTVAALWTAVIVAEGTAEAPFDDELKKPAARCATGPPAAPVAGVCVDTGGAMEAVGAGATADGTADD